MTKTLRFAVSANLIRACYTIASNDRTRFYLNGVHIKPGPGGEGAIVEATDGHLAVRAIDRKGIVNADNVLIQLNGHKSRELTPFKKHRDEVSLYGFEGPNKFRTSVDPSAEIRWLPRGSSIEQGETLGFARIEELGGTFPDLNRVTPGNALYNVQQGRHPYGVPVLKKALAFSEAFDHLCKQTGALTILSDEDENYAPAIFRTTTKTDRFEAMIVAMPVRQDGYTIEPPEWV